MSMFDALRISASGMTAERLRMDVIAGNLANANTTRTAAGGPYRRREVILQEVGGSADAGFATFGQAAASQGVEVKAVVDDASAGRLVYDPSSPDANAQGMVRMPNVEPVKEMVDLITATRAYEAGTTVINNIKTEFTRALDVLR
mgnify:CR=1 FL=1